MSSVLRPLSSVVCWLAMLIFTFHACTHMVAAGDTWVAMACGRHFINRGKVDNNPLPFRVDTIEPFSANSHKPGPTEEEIKTWPNWAQWIANKVGIETVKYWHPTGWIDQNWLTQVIFYSLIPKTSYADGVSFPSNALVYWKFAIYILTVICVYYTARLMGVNPALCAVFSCFAMFIGRSFLDIRPAGFSNLLVALFLLILALVTYRNVLYIWLVVPVTVFWCNVHGGYIYAFIMLIPFFVLHLLKTLPRKWTVSAGSILLWVGLYALAYKFCVGLHKMILEFSSQYSFAPVPFYADKLFYLIVILSIASVLIAAIKRIKQGAFYGYHIAVSVIVMLALLIARFFPKFSIRLAVQQRDALSRYINSNLLTFLAIFAILTVLIIVMAFLKEKLVLIKLKGICHTAVVGIVALIASIVFNPFHLTNLTHTFVISVSEHAERWRNIHEWRPAFHWANLVGDERPFLVMFIIAWVALVIWIGVLIFPPRTTSRGRKRKAKSTDEYQRPKIDLPLMLIAALTVYMAIRSRRFIPIAAIAACPIIAMFIDQLVRGISVAHNIRKNNRLSVSAMPYNLQLFFILAGAVAVLFFGTWWGLKFKYVYLESWPRDPKFNSIFMRMTDSSQKPFYACKFIKDNKLKGKMFNYWTEGGFIGWGQEPDPNTGRTPLQLFMDGRAQAAYDRGTFDVWTDIMAGGREVMYPIVARARARGQELTSANYVKIGKWMDEQLRGHGVWVVLMPQTTYRIPPRDEYYEKTSYHAIQSLERSLNWRLVFFNNKQKLFVDVRTPQGGKLYEGIFNGENLYPDDFSKNLILARNTLLFLVNQLEQQRRQIEIAKKTVKAKLNNENLVINAKEKTVAQLRKKLAELSEQLKTVQEQLEVAEKEESLKLEEQQKQKEQIEKEKKTVQAKIDNENAIIKAKEKAVAESTKKLAQLSGQSKTIQKRLRDTKKQGFDFAVKAFKLNPSPAPIREIILVASRFAEIKPLVNKFCEDYLKEFKENEADWAQQDGHRNRLEAARLACFYLGDDARRQVNTKLAKFYAEQEENYLHELIEVSQTKRW